jgi:PTH1 family peptidyl-tRNA hydrolase
MVRRPKFVVGLGNPGAEYSGTRHNVGFAVLDEVARQAGCSFKKKWRFDALVAEWAAASGKVLLAKPQTFMNRSGTAVGALLKWRKILPAELLVVVDDADLPLGELRMRPGGGTGGHNGLRSITESLGGAEEFMRLRVGIGRSDRPGQDITDHVLGEFRAAERPVAEQAVARGAEAVQCCVGEGLARAMNQFNRKQTGE